MSPLSFQTPKAESLVKLVFSKGKSEITGTIKAFFLPNLETKKFYFQKIDFTSLKSLKNKISSF